MPCCVSFRVSTAGAAKFRLSFSRHEGLKFKKNLLAVLTIQLFLLSSVKKSGRFFKFLWPFQKSRTLREYVFCQALFSPWTALGVSLTTPHVPICTGAPWDTATKNVKKPLGEKGRTFRKSKCYLEPM